jgi:hypothetical protein
MALNREGPVGVAEHLDLTGRVGLHPDGRLVAPDMAENRSEDELRH